MIFATNIFNFIFYSIILWSL